MSELIFNAETAEYTYNGKPCIVSLKDRKIYILNSDQQINLDQFRNNVIKTMFPNGIPLDLICSI